MRIRLLAAALLACTSTIAPALTFGPPIAGMCLLSRTAAIASSRAGQSMQAQLKQMQGALSGEITRQRATIDQQRRALDTQQNSIAPIEYRRQLSALNRQAQILEQQQNARFITAQARGQQQIDGALNNALERVITSASCSVVLERSNAYGWNNTMDITPAVTREMDGLLPAVVLQ